MDRVVPAISDPLAFKFGGRNPLSISPLTLSNHPFILRLPPLPDNMPEKKSRRSYQGLLDPDSFRRHSRGSATASLTNVAGSDDVNHSHSNTTSVTNVDHLPNSPTNEKEGFCAEEDKKGVDKEKGRFSSHGEGQTQVVPRQLEETVEVISSSSVALQCYICHSTTTPLWRKDGGGNTVCNSCVSYYELHGSTRLISTESDAIRMRYCAIIAGLEATPSTSPNPSRPSSPVWEASPTLAPDSTTQLFYESEDSDAFRAISAPTSSELVGALGALNGPGLGDALPSSSAYRVDFDPAPSPFKPYELDPESTGDLAAYGMNGLRGLGTNGLVTNTEHIRSSESSHNPNLGAGESACDLPKTEAGENSDDGEQARHLGLSPCPDDNLDSSNIRREMIIQKRKSKPMIQGKEITISGGNLTNVEGDYHEHKYVFEETPTYPRYLLDTIPDMFKKLDAKLNNLLNFPLEEYNRKSDDSRQTMHSSSRVENENMGDTSAHVYGIETHFNSLNDPPQPTSVFDDGYCIYQTPTPARINSFTSSSRTFSAMAQDGRNLSSGNQHPYPFGYWVPGIVHYLPCWLPSWGGWIAAWTSWISPPAWIWPSFV